MDGGRTSVRLFFYNVCGARHWQYHSVDTTGFEEFSTGAFVEDNSRTGRKPGGQESTNPETTIRQPYCMIEDPSGGYLKVSILPKGVEGVNMTRPQVTFAFYDDHGNVPYVHRKSS